MMAPVLATPMQKGLYFNSSLSPNEDELSKDAELNNQLSAVNEYTPLLSTDERDRINANTVENPRMSLATWFFHNSVKWFYESFRESIKLKIVRNKAHQRQILNLAEISRTFTVPNYIDQRGRYWEDFESDLIWVLYRGDRQMSYIFIFSRIWRDYRKLDGELVQTMEQKENEIDQTLDIHGILSEWDRCRDKWGLFMTSFRGEPYLTYNMYRTNAKFGTLSTFSDVALIKSRQELKANQHFAIMHHYIFAETVWKRIIEQVNIKTLIFDFRYTFSTVKTLNTGRLTGRIFLTRYTLSMLITAHHSNWSINYYLMVFWMKDFLLRLSVLTQLKVIGRSLHLFGLHPSMIP